MIRNHIYLNITLAGSIIQHCSTVELCTVNYLGLMSENMKLRSHVGTA